MLRDRQAKFAASTGSRYALVLIALAFLFLLSGCGKKLNGRYEATQEIPRMTMPGIDPKVTRQFDAQMRKVAEMNTMTLEFDGSKVRWGTPTAISEYKYRIEGKRLEIFAEAMGTKTIIPMILEEDGSISYSLIRFHKVQ